MLQQEIKKHRTRRVLYIVLAVALFAAMLVPVFLKRSGTAASVGGTAGLHRGGVVPECRQKRADAHRAA